MVPPTSNDSDRPRRRDLVNADGVHLSHARVAFIAGCVAVLWQLWPALRALSSLSDVPATQAALMIQVRELATVVERLKATGESNTQAVLETRNELRAVRVDVEAHSRLLSGFEAAKGAADALHDRQDRRLTALEADRRR